MGNISLLGYILTTTLILLFPFLLYLSSRFIKKNGVRRYVLCVLSLYIIIVISSQCKYLIRNQFFYEMKNEFQDVESITMYRYPGYDVINIHLRNNAELLNFIDEISLLIFSEVINGNNSHYYDNLLRNPSWLEINYGNRVDFTICFKLDQKPILELWLEDDEGSYFFSGKFNDEVIKIPMPPN